MNTVPQPFGRKKLKLFAALRKKGRASIPTLPSLLLRALPGAFFYFLLSIAQCLFVPSPYAICCLSVSLFTGLKTTGALPGLLAGLLLRMLWGIEWDTAQYLTCGLGFLIFQLFKVKDQKALAAVIFLLLAVRSLPGIIAAENTQTVILYIASVLTGTASVPALVRAARMVKEKRRESTEDDLLCFLLPVLLTVNGASRIALFSANLGFLLAAFLTLLTAWAAGAAAGVCISLGFGIALLLGGQPPVMLLWLALSGLAAGVLQGRSKALVASAFLLSGCGIQFLTTFSLEKGMPIAAAVGCACFLLLNGRPQKRVLKMIRRLCWRQPRENLYTRYRMQKWAGAIESMAKALPASRIEPHDPEEESEAIAERLCDQCDLLPVCWRDRYAATRESMNALAMRTPEGEDGYLPVINRYFSACARISRIPALLEEMDSIRLERMRRSICADYEREMLSTHLFALSQAALRISMEGGILSEEENEWLNRTEEALQGLRFPGHVSFVKRVNGKMTVCVQCEPLTLRPNMPDTLRSHIGVRLGVTLQVTEQKGGRIMLEEEPPLRVISGMATACAVTRERKLRMGIQPDNGDDVLVRRLSGGRMLLALSDGMGHGAGAQDESRKTLELLSLCMEAGYDRGEAVKAVNGVMLSVTGGEKFSTVDLCMIDLWNGRAAINKLGACASFLIQGRKLHRLEGHALPLGIVEHILPTESEVSLAEGDLLLMMSDGVTDAFEGEEEILSLFRGAADDAPQHIADMILQEAIVQQGGLPKDDMTVLCAQVVSSHPEKRKRQEIMSA